MVRTRIACRTASLLKLGMHADGTRDGGIWPPQIYNDPDPSPPLRGVASVMDVCVLTPTFFPVGGFNTHTFSAVFPQFRSNGSRQSHSFSGCPVSALAAAQQLPHLPLPLLLLLETWHRLWVWPADDWLFCLKSRLSCYVKVIVQLVLIRRDLP